MKILAPAIVSIILVSCSYIPALTKDQCSQENWRDIGIKDGLKAYPHNQVMRRLKECKRYDIALDIEEYKQGYIDAVLHRCTHRYGKLVGYDVQKPKQDVCPDSRKEEYMQGYREGVTESVSDQMDPLLTKPVARERRESRIKAREERNKENND